MAATTAVVLAGIAATAAVAGGIQQYQAGQTQAKNAKTMALFQAQESERVAVREAQLASEEADATSRKQKLAYLASGVSLEGSPLLVMEETRRKGQENVDEILAGGAASSAAAGAEGRISAQNAKSAGRAALMSGLTSAGNTGYTAWSAK